MEIRANKHMVKLALKTMGKKKREVMAELSKEEFIEKIRSNPKAKNISDDMIEAMYDGLMKKVNK